MDQGWEEIAKKLRAQLPAGSWERALSWNTSGLVVPTKTGKEEVWAVRPPGQSRAVEVTFWPEDSDWECSCELPACMHAAAAVLVRATGAVMPVVVQELAVKYRLFRVENQLGMDRQVPVGALKKTVDQELNRELAVWWGKAIPKPLMPKVLPLLRELKLSLDGKPIQIDPRPVMPVVRVEDAGPDIRVRLVRAAGIEEVFVNGLVRIGDFLKPIGKADLEEGYAERLKNGMLYQSHELQRLVVQDLPALRKKLQVEILSQRVPEVVQVLPRLAFEVEASLLKLGITARLLYGDPAVARVERGKLVLLGKKLPVRDEEAERRLMRELEQLAPGLAINLTIEREGEAALGLIDGLRGRAREEVLKKAPHFTRLKERVVPTIVLGEGAGGGFKLQVEAGGVDPEQLLKAWQEGASFVPLQEGGWRPVPGEWLQQHGAILQELLLAKEGKEIPRHAASLVLQALQDLELPVPESLQGIRALAGDFSSIPTVAVPPGLKATLRPYQQSGLDWLMWLRSVGMGGILADDMGLGKTLQCLTMLASTPGRHLVVAPTSVIRNWEQEAAKFLPELRVCLYHGPKRELDTKAALTLTTYAILRLDQEALGKEPWATVVLDEAQAIKNHASQAAQAAFSLKADHKLALSGTPIENRLEELWSAFHFVAPGLLGSLKNFQDRFVSPISVGNQRAQKQLRARIRPFVLRRLKSEVARDLPPRTSLILRCTLTAEERALYQGVKSLGKAEAAQLLERGSTLSVLEVLLRMRQAACHGGLLSSAWEHGSSKLELLMENLEQIVEEGHRALVFSQWTSLLNKVEPELKSRGLRFVRLDGSTTDRAEVVTEFMKEDGPPVFLLSLKAGGTGLNLTKADYVFHLDPWWNPAVEDQATDRAHRIGQENPVVSCRLIAENTVEERIIELQERKRELVRAALDEEALAKSITREELLALFE